MESRGTRMRTWQRAAPFVLVGTLYLLNALEPLEFALMDLRFRLLPPPTPSQQLVVVEIDSRSLEALDYWPWPRDHHARVIDILSGAGAKAIVVDLDLSSTHVPASDRILEKTLSEASLPVALPVFRQNQHNPTGTGQTTVTRPLDRFARHANLVSINVQPDSDGNIRRMVTEETFNGTAAPTASAFLAGPSATTTDSYYIDYSFRLTDIPRVSYIDVMREDFDRSTIDGKKVLIGATALELRDHVPVPIHHIIPGALLHALAFESLAQDRALIRTSAVPTLAVMLLLAFALPALFRRLPSGTGLAATLAMCIALLIIAAGMQYRFPVIVDCAPWVLVTIAVYLAMVFGRIDQQTIELFIHKRIIRGKDLFMQNIVENSFDGIVTLFSDGTVKSFNRAAERMFRIRSSNAIGKSVDTLIPGLSPLLRDENREAGSDGTAELSIRRANNAKVPVEVAITRMDYEDQHIFICMLRDITERKRRTEMLKFQALHDDLTGLPNRTLLMDRATQTLHACERHNSRFSLLLVDLDNFKDINDTLGHHIGDALLKRLAKNLKDELRATDSVARLGGDEFAVLVSEMLCEEDVYRIARKITQTVEEPVEINGLLLRAGASIGCSIYPDHGHDVNTLLQKADVAMYEAKRSKSVFAIYDFEFDNNSIRQLTLSGELKHAIENGGLSVYYQPQVDLRTNQVTGVEALLRWNHPSHGMIPPDEFVPMAERTGLITRLTEWVLTTALQECRQLRQAGSHITVSINLSTKDLLNEAIPNTIEKLMRNLDVSPSWLSLEITESNIMSNPERAMETLRQLNRMDIRLAIDDFGTGYSSLAYLKRLPIDEIKIDKTFVQDMTRDENDLTIVRSTIDLAHRFGLDIIAEGVESVHTLDLLRDMGCDIAQGHFLCRPVPRDELLRWIETTSWNPRPCEAADTQHVAP